jgi:hypothetical protein
MKKLLLTGALLAVVAAPAFAESGSADFGTGNVRGHAAATSEAYGARGTYGAGAYESGYSATDGAYGGDVAYGNGGGYGAAYGGGYGDYAMADRGYDNGGYDSYAMAGPVAAGPGRCWISTSSSRAYGYYGSCASQDVDTDAGLLGQAIPNKSLERP